MASEPKKRVFFQFSHRHISETTWLIKKIKITEVFFYHVLQLYQISKQSEGVRGKTSKNLLNWHGMTHLSFLLQTLHKLSNKDIKRQDHIWGKSNLMNHSVLSIAFYLAIQIVYFCGFCYLPDDLPKSSVACYDWRSTCVSLLDTTVTSPSPHTL